MDAQHRHELKTNELADWLTHLPQFFKENSNTIIGVALICAGLITWPMFTRMSQAKNIAEQAEMTESIQMLGEDVANVLQAPPEDVLMQTEALNTMLVNADNLLDKASEVDNPNLAAMAQIKAAQAIRTQLQLSKTVDTETLEIQIQKAQDAYQKAFETAQTPTLKAMAQLGLGLCSEELGQTAQAGEIYQQIVDNEEYQPTAIPALAQQRLDSLEENAESFTFAETPAVDMQAVTEINDQQDLEQFLSSTDQPNAGEVSLGQVEPETTEPVTPDTAAETPEPTTLPESSE